MWGIRRGFQIKRMVKILLYPLSIYSPFKSLTHEYYIIVSKIRGDKRNDLKIRIYKLLYAFEINVKLYCNCK